MIASDLSKRLMSAGFILAGIAFIMLNACLLADFFGRPLAKRSEGLKLVSMKWEQFTAMTESFSTDLVNNIISVNAMDRPEPAVQPQGLPTEHSTVPPTAPLPVLAGVFQVLDVDQNSEYIAIIEGKRLQKHDRVKDFTIENITAKGVVLNKNGQTVFIPAPLVFFSLSRKEGIAGPK